MHNHHFGPTGFNTIATWPAGDFCWKCHCNPCMCGQPVVLPFVPFVPYEPFVPTPIGPPLPDPNAEPPLSADEIRKLRRLLRSGKKRR